MRDRRIEPRMLCADLVTVRWEHAGQAREAVANLENISRSGICLQLDVPVPADAVLRVAYPKGEFVGQVRYCAFCGTGYFIGVKFASGYRWTQKLFRPQHLLDPRRLLGLRLKRKQKAAFAAVRIQ